MDDPKLTDLERRLLNVGFQILYRYDEKKITTPTPWGARIMEDLRSILRPLEAPTGDRQADPLEGLEDVLEALVDDDACSLDRHGYCQTHFTGQSPCLMPKARKILESLRAVEPGKEGGAA